MWMRWACISVRSSSAFLVSGPKYAGLDKVNPGSMILSGVEMLRFMGWDEAAERVVSALKKTISQGTVTYDLARLMEGASASDRPSVSALVEPSAVYMDGTLPTVTYPVKTQAHHLSTLDARALTYRYPGAYSGAGSGTKAGIEGIDLHLERGTLTVITGRVGAGKTTLLRVLLGLLPMDAGEIRWNGEAVEDPGAFFVPPRSAYTAQVRRLFSNSLRNNILMGLDVEDEALM